MKPIHHVIVSTGVSAVFAYWAKSWGGVGACFLSGILIDLDHHLDYWIYKKELPVSYKKLKNFLKNDHGSKLYLVFHSYELLGLLWFSIYYFHLNMIWLGVGIGTTVHLICDEFVNPLRPFAYFLIYRIRTGFERKHFLKKGFHPEAY